MSPRYQYLEIAARLRYLAPSCTFWHPYTVHSPTRRCVYPFLPWGISLRPSARDLGTTIEGPLLRRMGKMIHRQVPQKQLFKDFIPTSTPSPIAQDYQGMGWHSAPRRLSFSLLQPFTKRKLLNLLRNSMIASQVSHPRSPASTMSTPFRWAVHPTRGQKPIKPSSTCDCSYDGPGTIYTWSFPSHHASKPDPSHNAYFMFQFTFQRSDSSFTPLEIPSSSYALSSTNEC